MKDLSFEFAVEEPFSLKACLAYLNRSSLECLHQVKEDTVLKLLQIQGTDYLIELSSGNNGNIKVTSVMNKPMSGAVMEQIKLYIRSWFDLDRNIKPWQSLVEQDSLLSKMPTALYGLRLIGIPDLFEAMCWAIAGQQVNLAFAYRLKARLVEHYGKRTVWDGDVYYSFPSPSDLSAIDPAELQMLQFTKAKARTIIQIAQQMDNGLLTKERLLQLNSFSEAERQLVQIKGIGAWTANYVKMRCLRDPSAFPIADVGLQNAVKVLLCMSAKPTQAHLRQLFEPYKGWEAYATFYLWNSLAYS